MTVCSRMKEEFSKELNRTTLNELNSFPHKLALKRKVALNLLTDWGIKDQQPSPIVAGVPPGTS